MCFLFKMENSGTLTLRVPLESQLCPCPSRDRSTPAGRGLSLLATCIHFLVRNCASGLATTHYQLQFIAKNKDSSIRQMNFLAQATLCGLDTWCHYLNSLNFLASGFSLAFTSRISFLLPTLSSFLNSTLVFFIFDHK